MWECGVGAVQMVKVIMSKAFLPMTGTSCFRILRMCTKNMGLISRRTSRRLLYISFRFRSIRGPKSLPNAMSLSTISPSFASLTSLSLPSATSAVLAWVGASKGTKR